VPILRYENRFYHLPVSEDMEELYCLVQRFVFLDLPHGCQVENTGQGSPQRGRQIGHITEIIDTKGVNPTQHLCGPKGARIEIGKNAFEFLK
jgi:hypothetical protein